MTNDNHYIKLPLRIPKINRHCTIDRIAFFGSADIDENDPIYREAFKVAKHLASNGKTIVNGGGPGIMEAANKGAFEAGGVTVGINIQLPFEQRINPYVKESVGFFYFFTRKVMLTSPADAFVFFPGGFGTMDEFFEVVDYMELGQMRKTTVVLVGKEFWTPLLNFLNKTFFRAYLVNL